MYHVIQHASYKCCVYSAFEKPKDRNDAVPNLSSKLLKITAGGL